jgi:lycopene beta-cyclase
MSKRHRIAILGAGLSGLSLAHRLSDQHEVSLFDPHRQDGADRSFGYFRVHAHPFERVVTQRYSNIAVYSDACSVVRSPAARYERIDGAALYRTLWAGTSATLFKPTQFDAGSFDLCFDSSPRWDAPEYWQVFVGGEFDIRGSLNPLTAVLMDFRNASPRNADLLRFVYVLPLSAERALIQQTYIVTHAQRARLGLETHEQELRAHMQRFFQVDVGARVRGENGAIPLYLKPETSNAFFNIGGRAAWVRASTGYSFLETQRAVDAIAANVAQGALKATRSRPKHLDRMDALFLRAVTHRAEIAGEWFTAMFAHANVNALVGFLAGTAGIGASAQVAASLLRSGYARDFLSEVWSAS